MRNHPRNRFSTASALRAALCASTVVAVAAGCASPASSEIQATTPATQSSDKPNILMILLDDLGYTDLGPYGGDAATPNIDALAGEGLQFSNFHADPVGLEVLPSTIVPYLSVGNGSTSTTSSFPSRWDHRRRGHLMSAP